MKDLNRLVSDRFKAVMAAQHLTVSAYAARTGQERTAASRRVNGTVPLTLADLEKFCRVTGYRPDEFLAERFVLRNVGNPAQAIADALADDNDWKEVEA